MAAVASAPSQPAVVVGAYAESKPSSPQVAAADSDDVPLPSLAPTLPPMPMTPPMNVTTPMSPMLPGITAAERVLAHPVLFTAEHVAAIAEALLRAMRGADPSSGAMAEREDKDRSGHAEHSVHHRRAAAVVAGRCEQPASVEGSGSEKQLNGQT